MEQASNKAVLVVVCGASGNDECSTVERLLVENVIVDSGALSGMKPDNIQMGAVAEGEGIDDAKGLWQRHLTQTATTHKGLVAYL